MNKNIVKEITARQIRNDIPSFASGDTVKVSVRITENGKTRIQNFEGVVMERRGGGIGETFTVRKMSGAVGVERTWSLNSPVIASIQLLKVGKVRRNKIYYLRDLRGKSARIKEVLKKWLKKHLSNQVFYFVYFSFISSFLVVIYYFLFRKKLKCS